MSRLLPFIIMFTKMVMVICYRNGEIIASKTLVSYGGLLPVATIIRSQVTLENFMSNLYHLTSYEICLVVPCRYPVPKDYIVLWITD